LVILDDRGGRPYNFLNPQIQVLHCACPAVIEKEEACAADCTGYVARFFAVEGEVGVDIAEEDCADAHFAEANEGG